MSMRMLLRLAVVGLLGLGLSGCDKCGDWFGQGKPGACRSSGGGGLK